MNSKTLYQGAEAIISLKNNQVIKHRIKKSYRLSELDEKIRRIRTKKEAKLIEKANQVINVPKIINVDNEKNTIVLEYIKGKKLSQHLDKLKNRYKLCEQIGKDISKLHAKDIIHGDLTTSNMILKEGKINRHDPNLKEGLIKGNFGSLYFIDFGLGFVSGRIEDKAVDIHLLKQALEAKHFKFYDKCIKAVIKGYLSNKNYKEAKEIIERLKKVESRGRYKH